MYYLIRQYVLAIAQLRGLGDDIFFMTFEEILDDDRSNIARNRERSTRAIGTSKRLTKSDVAIGWILDHPSMACNDVLVRIDIFWRGGRSNRCP